MPRIGATPQVWLITGSSRGIGRKTAEAVLAAGHQLVATSRKPYDLEALVQEHGDRVRTVALDVRDAVQARNAVRAAVEAFGRLDVVMNNAGVGHVMSVEEGADADFREQLEVNFWGAVNVTRAALPVFRAQRTGHFLQIGSLSGRLAVGPGLVSYSTAKFALHGFSLALAQEMAPLGVKVTLVEPGGFRTDWLGCSLLVTEPGEDYRATVGAMAEGIRAAGDLMTGDPAKAARVLVEIAASEDPPLRLLLGSDALQMARMADQARNAEIDKWEHVSRSTDFDPV
ncbi:oxidoreductase [Lentzea sp. NPDC051213]|uniref:oxidoreductase n=1 Tax=Lentzea sp. NPDC051213 TaxID=3364126 RepID=UPI003790FA20